MNISRRQSLSYMNIGRQFKFVLFPSLHSSMNLLEMLSKHFKMLFENFYK